MYIMVHILDVSCFSWSILLVLSSNWLLHCRLRFARSHFDNSVGVQVGEGVLDVRNRQLQKQLNLTTADMRFMETIVRTVDETRGDGLFVETGVYGVMRQCGHVPN